MNIAVRPADLDMDRDLIVETLRRYLTILSDSFRFEWLYRSNPWGLARTWIALDLETRKAIGIASAFPRMVFMGSREALAWVLGDFCIDDRYRSLGPALQLQRACLAAIDSEAAAFCYDFPSASMMAVYKRLRIDSFGQIIRLAKPLRVDRKIGQIAKIPLAAHGLSAAGNLLLALRDYRPEGRGTLTISLHRGACNEEFSNLAYAVGGRYGVCVQRSAAYLNWRYLANPLARYELLTARWNDALRAFAVFCHAGMDATLVDLFGIEEPATIVALVDRLVTLLRKRGVVTISAPIIGSHPWFSLLQRLGFRAREATPVIVYAPADSHRRCGTPKCTNWYLMHGDRDN